MILISNVRTSASKKINLMALIRTLTILTVTFERIKEKFYGFRQTELLAGSYCIHTSEIHFFKNGGAPHFISNKGCFRKILGAYAIDHFMMAEGGTAFLKYS